MTRKEFDATIYPKYIDPILLHITHSIVAPFVYHDYTNISA